MKPIAKFDKVFKQTEVKKPEAHPRRETKWLHYTKLVDNTAQYCDEKDEEEIKSLAELIDADEQVLQNLLVRKIDADEYEIIAGHKRRRACKWLVEKGGKKKYEFLPCTVENLSDVRAEFQVYSSNTHHQKTDYEKMHELERMKYLLETYPEEFLHLQTGRMVERLAAQMKMKRTTVGEYLQISNKLIEQGKDQFKTGTLKKSAAVELSKLPKDEQKGLLSQGVTSYAEIKAYKERKEEPAQAEIRAKPEIQIDKPELPMPVLEADELTDQLPGQFKVINTDMDVEADVPDFGTSDDDETVSDRADFKAEHLPMQEQFIMQEEKEEYSAKYFLDEQNGKLNQMIKAKNQGDMVPEISFERQKTIVFALGNLVNELQNIELEKDLQQRTQPELPQLKNNEQRKEWLRNYKEWGIWYRDEHVGAIYYKYDFPDGTRLIAETYQNERYGDSAFMHLVGGPKKRELNQYGCEKYPYHECYSRYPDNETELIEFLKAIQKKS